MQGESWESSQQHQTRLEPEESWQIGGWALPDGIQTNISRQQTMSFIFTHLPHRGLATSH